MDALLLRGSWSLPAAAPLRASWSPPATVAAAYKRARPAHRLVHANPARRDVYLPPVKVHCQKGADQFAEPEPERENVNEPASAESSENPETPLCEQARKNRKAFRAAMRVRVAPDMESMKNQITNNCMIDMFFSGVNILNVNPTVLAKVLGARVETALDLASKVMDIANVGLGATKNSEHTTNQMVIGTYTSTFLNVAEDAYQKRIEMEAVIISFLDALRGLGAICLTLVEGTMELEDRALKYSITRSMDDHTQEYNKKMNKLKDKFMAATITGAYKIVTDILLDETLDAHHLYLLQLIECREAALIKG